MIFDYALYRLGRTSAESPFGTRLSGSTYSELLTVRNLRPGPEELALIRSLPPRGIMFDVGAHVGIWSCALATAHPQAVIHAFEANPSTFATLQRNVARNRLENIKLNSCAASDAKGSVEFQTPLNASLFGRIRANKDSRHRFDNSANIKVPTIRLADYCQDKGISRVDFLKVDVEGAEPLVLRGLLAHIPVSKIWIEVDEGNLTDMGYSIAVLAEVVNGAGYRFLMSDGSETDIRERRQGNMLVVPR